MIETFTPSITAREWGTGVSTAGGGDAGFDFQKSTAVEISLAALRGQPRAAVPHEFCRSDLTRRGRR
jgi:hypothetical protein